MSDLSINNLIESLDIPSVGVFDYGRKLSNGKKDCSMLRPNLSLDIIKNDLGSASSKHIALYLKLQNKDDDFVSVLDIDDESISIDESNSKMKEMFGVIPPYTLSSFRKKPHYYFLTNKKDFNKSIDCFKDFKADLLSDFVVEENNTQLFSGSQIGDLDLPLITWDKLIKHFKASANKSAKIKPISENNNESSSEFKYIKNELADNFVDWFKVLRIAKFNDISYKEFDDWSKSSLKYNDENNKKIWDSVNILELSKVFFGKKQLKLLIKEGKMISTTERILVETEQQAVKHILKNFEDTIIWSDGLYIYDGKIWEFQNPEAHLRVNIRKLKGIYKEDSNGNLINLNGSIEKSTILAKAVIDELIVKYGTNMEFRDKFRSSTKAKLCFKNGVLDFKTKKFTSWDDIKPNEIYTTFYINYDYKPCNEVVKLEVINKIFKAIFNDDWKYALQYLSRALAGHFEDKVWSIFSGQRNCGKGVIDNFLSKTFEKYIGHFNPDELIFKKSTASTNLQLNWLLDMEFSRISFGNELSSDKFNVMNGSLIKNICSGGDKINVRALYKSQREITLQTSLVINCNQVVSMNPEDTYETCIGFSFPKTFITADKINEYKKKGWTDEQLSLYNIKDDKIKDKCDELEYKYALIQLMLDYYIDSEVPKRNIFGSTDGKTLAEQIREKFSYDSEAGLVFNKTLQKIAEDFGTNRKTLIEIIQQLYPKVVEGKSGSSRGLKFLHIIIEDNDDCEEEIQRHEKDI